MPLLGVVIMPGISRLGACRALAFVSALGLAMAFGPAAGASTAVTHHARLTPAARALAAARAELRHLTVDQHGTARLVGGGRAGQISGQSEMNSTNWSGYADYDTLYNSVTGSWSQPALQCGPGENSFALFWAGFDGLYDYTVEQDGTVGECYEGASYYFTWWEMYPTNEIQAVGGTVHPGDSITASVTVSGDSYTLAVTDATTPANSFTTIQTCTDCVHASAEWIAETLTASSGTPLPLSDFGSWTLTNAAMEAGLVSGGISSEPYQEITMVNSSSVVEAQPGALSSSGSAFTVTWEGTPPPPPRVLPVPPPGSVHPPSRQPPPR
jgi:hypothetical protein